VRLVALPIPPRIEHIPTGKGRRFPRFKALGVLASVQPIHQVTDRTVAQRKWGCAHFPVLRVPVASPRREPDSSSDPTRPSTAPALFSRSSRAPTAPGRRAEAQAFHPEQAHRLRAGAPSASRRANLVGRWGTSLGKIEAGWARIWSNSTRTCSKSLRRAARGPSRGVLVAGAKVSASPYESVDSGDSFLPRAPMRWYTR